MSSDIDELRREIDIVDVVSEYVNLERVGSNYRTNCPFHPDRTPSFFVSPSKQIFKCFGCGVGGDAIKFVAIYEGISYLEAAIQLAKRYGKTLSIEKISKQEKILIALDRASDFYQENLYKNSEAVEYLKSRKIDGKVLRKFGVGYSPSGEKLAQFLKKEGLLEDYLKTKNLIQVGKNSYKDLFQKRVVIPVKSPSGRVIGFGGRRIREDNSPKYVNSPDSDVFKKGKNLFGLYETKDYIKEEGFAILVEGYFDLLKLFSEGIRNVVAPLGTAFTNEQAQLLSKYTKRVFILYDGDEAGRKSAERVIPFLLQNGLEVYPVYLPEGYDPDSFVQEYGSKALKELIQSSKELFESLIEKAKENLDEAVKDFKYYIKFVSEDEKKIELAGKFYKNSNYLIPFESLISGNVKKDSRKSLSLKEKILIKGLLTLKPKVNLEELKISEDLKKLCECALKGEEENIPKEIFEFKVENLEKNFSEVIEDFKKGSKRRRKKLKNLT